MQGGRHRCVASGKHRGCGAAAKCAGDTYQTFLRRTLLVSAGGVRRPRTGTHTHTHGLRRLQGGGCRRCPRPCCTTAAAPPSLRAACAVSRGAGGGHDGGSHRVSGHANGQSSAGRVSSAQVCHSSASCVLGVDCWCRGQNWPSSHPLPPHRAAPVHPIWVVLWPFDLHLRGCAARDALLVWPWDGCWGVGFPLRRDSLACACLPLPRRRVTAPATAPWAPCLRPTASAARRLGVSCISRLTRWPSAPGAWPRA